MKYINTISIFLGVALLSSCVKHEVVPKPTYESDLSVSFQARMDGASYEIIEDIKGFSHEATQSKEINPSPQASAITYNSTFSSSQKTDVVELRMGKLLFSSNNTETPSVENFYDFFYNGITQPIQFKDDAEDGVEFYFVDGSGRTWLSKENSGFPESFEFTDLEEDTDEQGDYLSFVARFNVTVFTNPSDLTLSDTLEIQDAVFQGYFER
ncbi:hypothetical protein [Brumimicrobium aurantiacum]|nr:hypothetical protein [Brumimicrobium aurantiacum]